MVVVQGDAFTHTPVALESPVAGDQVMLLPSGSPLRQRVAESHHAMFGGSTEMRTSGSVPSGGITVTVAERVAVLVKGGQLLPHARVEEMLAV